MAAWKRALLTFGALASVVCLFHSFGGFFLSLLFLGFFFVFFVFLLLLLFPFCLRYSRPPIEMMGY